jgi:4-hydroxythreonine-4-phosphate dehydrogenase
MMYFKPDCPLPPVRLAVTLGDPAGIGPEVLLKALAEPGGTQNCELTIVGSQSLLQKTYQHLCSISNSPLANPDQFSILDLPMAGEKAQQVILGQGNAASGAASFHYLKTAIAHTLAGEFDGIVTGPIAKSAWNAAGHHYPGQTELLAEMAGVERFGMLFVARSPHTGWTLRTLLATTHIPLRAVPEALTPELMTRKLDLLVECLRWDFGIDSPRIAIAGLNPHSGEQGQLGREEQDWLLPWLRAMGDRHPNATLSGPVPPDTLWVEPGRAWFGISPSLPLPLSPSSLPPNSADAYLALYHDQGLIPVKLMAFDRAINTSIGLPFVRTSPDHGTAFNIAGRGIADATSMKAAIQLAAELSRQRQSRPISGYHRKAGQKGT